MTETKTLPVVEERAAGEGCSPTCGPDTCGCDPQVQLRMVRAPMTKHETAATEQCCDPDCGPDTCG